MIAEQENIHNIWEPAPRKNQIDMVPLYPGIELRYLTLVEGPLPVRHEPLEDMLQIYHCLSGQLVWQRSDEGRVCLEPGNLSLHTMKLRADSVITIPTGRYQGLVLSIDLREAAAHPPEPLRDTGIFERDLWEKFCRNGAASFLPGNERLDSIFSAFYDPAEHLRLPYQRIKVLELLLYLARMEPVPRDQPVGYRPDQAEIVREIHDRLLYNLERRITIEELSRQYLINPTTLKTAFKAVYGTSIAAHIKEHRMEQAAQMLKETDKTIAEIAQAVGYDSQSKFTAAFKAFFQVLPREYRKQFGGPSSI